MNARKEHYLMDTERIKKKREIWNTEQVPGCKQKNCSQCPLHKSQEIKCPLQKKELKKLGMI